MDTGSLPIRTYGVPVDVRMDASRGLRNRRLLVRIQSGVLTYVQIAPLSHTLPTSDGQDPELALIVGAWDRLPQPLKAGIVAMVRAAVGS
jgi:hypothetical protein